MAYKKGVHSSSSGGNHRARPYALMFILAFGAALLGAMAIHRLRERRIYNLLVKEKDRELLALHLLLQKERDRTKEMKRKNEEIKAKIYALRSQKMELDRRVQGMKSNMDSLKDEQSVMESALEEKQNEIRMLQGKGSNLGKGGAEEVIPLTENLMQKEAQIKELKHVINEDASKSNLTKFKDGEVTVEVEDEIKDGKVNDDRLIETDEHTQRQETGQVEGASGGGTAGEKITDGEQGKKNEDSDQDDDGAGATAKDTDEKVVDGKENKTIREEQLGLLENNAEGGGQHFNVEQLADKSGVAAGVKRKHGHVSRKKVKRWRMIAKNRLLGNNGISKSRGAVNMEGRKIYRDKQGELKDSTVGRVSDDENVAREEEGLDNNNPSKAKPQAELVTPEIHENREDSRNTIGNDTNHQVTNNGINMHPKKRRLDEIRQSEKQEDSFIQQNWSRRHITRADKKAGQAKPNMFHEEAEELKATDVQKQEKDVTDGDDDDFFKEFQSNFDEEEHKEEIDD